MDIKRILKALLKALCSVVITFIICGLVTLLIFIIKTIFGASTVSVVLYSAIFLCTLVMAISYYKEGGNK